MAVTFGGKLCNTGAEFSSKVIDRALCEILVRHNASRLIADGRKDSVAEATS